VISNSTYSSYLSICLPS
jgi:hypothetical protein